MWAYRRRHGHRPAPRPFAAFVVESVKPCFGGQDRSRSRWPDVDDRRRPATTGGRTQARPRPADLSAPYGRLAYRTRPMTTLDDVLSAAGAMQDEIDKIVNAVDDLWEQTQADWIWFRLSSIGVVLRDRGGGPVAAVLARGLLEQAAYWDWALATGVGRDLVPRQAALEFNRLHRLADTVDDRIWTEWLLPPGARLDAGGSEGMPRSAADAIKRLGSGLGAACLEPRTRRRLRCCTFNETSSRRSRHPCMGSLSRRRAEASFGRP